MAMINLLPPDACKNYTLLSNKRLVSIAVGASSSTNNGSSAGIVGILTIPPAAHLNSEEEAFDADSPFHPPTHKLALILHGRGGNKNYCYQSLLAQHLAERLGMYSFRFDFRGCGDSQDNIDPAKGRTIEQDVQDIQIVLDVLENGKKFKEIGLNLVLNAIVGHSRGAVAMFIWALKQMSNMKEKTPYVNCPNLINVAGRFFCHALIDNLNRDLPGTDLIQYRFGEYRKVFIPNDEVIDLGSQDLTAVDTLDEDIQVLSIYGLEDHIIPLEDATEFANRLASRHELKFVRNADHNFYGKVEINEENSYLNPENLPLKRGKVNYSIKVVDHIVDWLSHNKELKKLQMLADSIYEIPRWKEIDGISNFRDIGGWKSKLYGKFLKTGIIFRCADTSHVTETGKLQIKKLGIKQIFDLRSLREFKKANLAIDQVEITNLPIFKDNSDGSPQQLALKFKNLLTSWYTYKFIYIKMLKEGADSFKQILMYLRDQRDVPILYHCTAGKDRTGLMTMLILLILKVDKHLIAKEYELTTIGLKPDHHKIKHEFFESLTDVSKLVDLNDSTIGASFQIYQKLSPEEMFNNLISSRYESMIATIELMNDEYGTIENYCQEVLGLSINDLEVIRDNLLVDSLL